MQVPPDDAQDKRDVVPIDDRLLVDESYASKMLCVSRPTYRKWVKLGLILPVELPYNIRRNLYKRSDLEQLVASLSAKTCAATSPRGAPRARKRGDPPPRCADPSSGVSRPRRLACRTLGPSPRRYPTPYP